MARYHSIEAELPPSHRTHPSAAASWASRAVYAWVQPLLSLGNDRQLQPDDIWPLEARLQCKTVSAAFEPAFRSTRSIARAVASVYGGRLLVIGLVQAITVGCTLYGPIVLQQILVAVESGPAMDVTYVLGTIVALFLVRSLQALLTAHATYANQLVTVQLTSALQHLLFQKALLLDASARKATTAGELANLFSTDIQTIITFSAASNQIWLIPLQVVVILAMLYRVIGWSTFVGAGVIVLTLAANHVLANAQRNAFKTLMAQKDARMKVVHEVFGSIQVIKLNAWEEKFSDKLTRLRDAELRTMHHIIVLQSWFVALLYAAPVVVSIVSLAIYALVMRQSLTPATVFTALSLFTLLRGPMMFLPQIVANLMQAVVALKRIMEFLNMDEKDNDVVKTPETISTSELNAYAEKKIDIEIADATFAWDVSGKPLFHGINLQIKRGEFVLVHGAVGEGKSSLMSALLGEMHKRHGSLFVGGHVAYFSQQAWIQNLTIRDNILFGKPYDRKRYNAVLDACADADIFLLDSPLSAVDAIVSNEIFTKCFLGLLRHKTIVLVTHSPEIIASSYIDRSIELKQGKLLVTDVEKLDAPLLISPLKARVGFAGSGEFTDEDVFACRHTATQPSFVSPNVMSPGCDNLFCTPFDDTSLETYDETTMSGTLVFQEERRAGRVSSHIFSAYLDAIGGYPMLVFWALVISSWQVLSIAGDFWLTKWMADPEYIAHGPYHLAIFSLLSLGGVFFTILRTASILLSGLKASRLLFEKMTASLLRAPMAFFDANPVGRILNRYSSDLATVDTSIPMTLNSFLAMVFMAIFCLLTTIVAVRSLGLVLVPIVYLYFATGREYIHPAREVERVNKVTRSPLLSLIAETIDGALVIRAFGQKQVRRFQRLHHRNVDTNLEAVVAGQVITQWFSLRIQLTSALLLLVTFVSLVWARSVLSPGLIGLVLNYTFAVLPFFEWIVTSWSQIETAMVGPERLSEYAAIAPEAPRVIHGATAHDWPTTGHITFRNMSFRYKEHDALVLKDVNVDIASGEKIGIVGRTGAGKSSLTMALFRINELASGSISIDGVDIKSVGVKTLRSAIAIIPQNPVLFKGTLRNYLDPFSDYGDDQLWDALTKVMLQSRIASVDGQLESHVEENGENFSVGERQMLCMARALLRQARIVVMDEATAAIDHETDQNLQRVIRTAFAASTVLTIAHRLDTVLDCDRILVFDQGRLVQCDTPQQLIDDGTGIFYELCTEGGYLDKVLSSP
ncbi:hypothetical protein SPRG_19137 [Saprolegnia parasitica CBS 223.65]|uniref:Multidrug resistance-associated protein 1 n=1 Tax=Saprolegnia parasitica (strain CBS 223.65) TaxID=695850 RepID=A0A067CYR5_SAPPC|nr:hypothetical protein SPRG_19137 [Saprolegnia parasitica CBS 223.65]KDO34405.1 hypothetical protein SPRG_19137 [Saprolegnia parasitica CBS 223.65]|eukprot:XP_012195325.1 hypothetical protein SPRG_19137 [Saprolegnia parasitica CBS 223.65]